MSRSNHFPALKSIIITAVCFLLLVLVLPASTYAQQDEKAMSGSWKNDLYLTPTTNTDSFLNYDSRLTIGYRTGGLELESLTRLTDYQTTGTGGDYDGFYRQEFSADAIVGVFDTGTDVVFYPYDQRLEYWLSELTLPFGGINVTDRFLLQHVSDSEGYGAGMELTLSGETREGVLIEVRNLFGMEENEGELLGLYDGSGYDIQTGSQGPKTYPPESLHYVSTIAEASGLLYDCLEFDVTTEIDRQEGFEYSEFEFLLESEDWPLSIDTELRFTPQTKSVDLDPQLDFDWACLNVYTDLETTEPSGAYAFEVEGFALNDVNIGPVTLSGLTALSGPLYRLPNTSDIDLRAYNYILDPDEPYDEYYETTEFDQVFTVQYGEEKEDCCPGLSFAADVYFDRGGSDNFFDLYKVTGDATYLLTEDFELSTGVSIQPGKEDVEDEVTVRLGADVYF